MGAFGQFNYPSGGLGASVVNQLHDHGSQWIWNRNIYTRSSTGNVTGTTIEVVNPIYVLQSQFEIEEIDNDSILRTDILAFVLPFNYNGNFVIPTVGDIFTDPLALVDYEVKDILNQQIDSNILLWELQLRTV